MDTTPFPEAESPDLARYTLYARAEIVALLKQLLNDGTLITAYFGSASDFALTRLLEIRPKSDQVIFDCGNDPATQRRLLAAEHLTMVAFLSSVKVQFSATGAVAATHDDRPAFAIATPGEMLRLQRRDAFRVRTPAVRSPTVLVPHSAGSVQFEALRVIDLSISGLAVLSYPEKFDFAAGTTVAGCHLNLEGAGSVPVNLVVRHIDPLAPNAKERRCGCEFVNLSPQAHMQVQRYVNVIEAGQRRAAAAGRGT
jgi:c-di-GMP-binding flagellar brake protein YcgR